MEKPKRIQSLDVFRYLAVTFALWSHAMLQFGVDELLGGNEFLAIKSLTRTATPTLMILFGMMVEHVYLRKFQRDEWSTVQALLQRAVICYFCYLSLAVIALVFEHISAMHLVAAAVLVNTSPYANIFAMYALLLPLTIGLLAIRTRFGLTGVWALVAGIWAVDRLVIEHLPVWPDPLDHTGGMLLGIGDTWGPSILHSVTLVAAGMTISAALYTGRSGREKLGMLALAAVCAAILLVELAELGLRGVLESVVDLSSWRAHNEIAYFAYGLVAALLLLALAKGLTIITPAPVREVAAKIGGATLSYFFLGNALLLIAPVVPGLDVPAALVLCALVIVISSGAALAWIEVSRRYSTVMVPARFAGWLVGILVSQLRRLRSAQ